MEVGGIAVEVVRKEIKHLHVGVYPPHGRVRVAAPLRLEDEAVRLAVVSRLAWIRRHQSGFEQQDRQSQREMVTGESHYFLGRRYLLDVTEGMRRPSVSLVDNTTMRLQVRPGADREEREAVLQRWYRRQLREQLGGLVARWEPRVGRTITELRIRRMKTRWGSCNADARRIWLNLELVKKPVVCLEYILVHEMVHLIERQHTERFQKLMDQLMPTWRICRDELNRAPLAHEEWQY
ncbi:MAG: metal-dependent hydrolase [Gammaproteobacteria bacterium HGW-Gammaproteobacteria-7]|nr:MAG: metal-dependent hydrolase [Gammaproteobacteria bacterium HGW-Gammaproteobacteria-7]